MRATKNKNEFKILLVDDRPENLISLEELLIAEGRTFIRAGSGNEALKQVIKNEDIGLILLDVQMPEMDGFEVARILKSNPKTKDISIIFVTALSQHEEYVLKGFEEGAVDYLQKPLDINIVRAKVNVFEQLYRNQRDLKNTLAELNLINKQLEKFVSVVSHDLKSPLSSMIMVLDLLRANEVVQNNAELKDDINMLSQASGHLSDMIVSLLEYSRLSASQQTIEEVSTYELAQQVVEILFPPKHITVIVKEDLPVMHTSRIKLQQVLQNLVSNAIKYNNKPEGVIEIGARDKGPWVEFYVKDNGQGIAESDKERIFMLFATTENTSANDSSTGIGLNLLKVLVEEQGGKLWVDSVKDEGSTFYFEWKKDL